MQCPNCKENYNTEGQRQPRIIITCGHSFCRTCVQNLRKDGGTLNCPQCGQLCAEPDAPNVALMGYIEVQMQRAQKPGTVREIPAPKQALVCQQCNKVDAYFICFQCLPTGFRFCRDCNRLEHDREFGPVRSHKPRPIDEVKYGAILPTCTQHSRVCEYFSFGENQFACDECRQEAEHNPDKFMDIEAAVTLVRGKIPPLMTKVSTMRDQLQATQAVLNDHLSHIDQARMSTSDKLHVEFQDLELQLRKRLAELESRVEDTATHRKRLLNEQLERVEVALGATATSLIQANMLNQMQDYTLLQRAHTILEQMRKQIQQQQEEYLEPVVNPEIAVYIPPQFEETIKSLGVVSGGSTPNMLPCTIDAGLILVKWEAPENKVKAYEITCDMILVDDSELTLIPIPPFPRKCEVDGKDTEKRIDNIIPGKKYRFRIRSLDQAGWGQWSPSITGKMPGFPLKIGFTNSIIKLQLPADGLYHIVAAGAKAADGLKKKGGRGAIIEATFALNKNDFLEILVGGKSEQRGPCSGGGGGTFVGLNGRQDLLIAAGGGGGTRGYDDEDQEGKDANTDITGYAGHGREWAQGGNNGRAGKDANYTGPCWGYGGAGYVENSTTAQSFVAGGMPGDGGGFGGGGGVGAYGGGGGGGYSGGGGGRGGGGGGSYIRQEGIKQKRSLGSMGDGWVYIGLLEDDSDEEEDDDRDFIPGTPEEVPVGEQEIAQLKAHIPIPVEQQKSSARRTES